MMRCDRSQDLFARAWDDELTVAERETLEAHWSSCAACRRAYDEYARTLELVQALPRPVVSPDFAARVLTEARRREVETKRASRLGRPGWAFGLAPRPAFALAAAFAVAVGVGAIARLAPRGTAPGAPTIASSVAPAPVPALAPPAEPAPDRAPEVLAVTPRSESSPRANHAEFERRDDVTPAETRTAVTLAATPSRDEAASDAVTAVPDSLFDHTADVELVLDPVRLRRERGRGYTPVQTTVRGEAASITF